MSITAAVTVATDADPRETVGRLVPKAAGPERHESCFIKASVSGWKIIRGTEPIGEHREFPGNPGGKRGDSDDE